MAQDNLDSSYTSAFLLVLSGAIVLAVHLVNAKPQDFLAALPQTYSQNEAQIKMVDGALLTTLNSLNVSSTNEDELSLTKNTSSDCEVKASFCYSKPRALIYAVPLVPKNLWLKDKEFQVLTADLSSAVQTKEGNRPKSDNLKSLTSPKSNPINLSAKIDSQNVSTKTNLNDVTANDSNLIAEDLTEGFALNAPHVASADLNVLNFDQELLSSLIKNSNLLISQDLYSFVQEITPNARTYVACLSKDSAPKTLSLNFESIAVNKTKANINVESKDSSNHSSNHNLTKSPVNSLTEGFNHKLNEHLNASSTDYIAEPTSVLSFKALNGCNLYVVTPTEKLSLKARLSLWEAVLKNRVEELKKLKTPLIIFFWLITGDAWLSVLLKRRKIKTPNALKFKLGLMAVLATPIVFLWIFLSLSVQAPYFLSWASGSLGLMALAWHLLVRSLPMFKPNL